ncbi:hypothetical protein A9179_09705 [Pseudomonas alcaligenes]|uniref:Multifunctional fatty acid oxidation complex subunit alpha n=1 Tax=Aquipseudomonas alcaligenes TaxID=43263 RepID=A0ABR7S1G5_AQUAC|nr:PA1571 family protein [Pseudomonas alcaligenes]MBC9250547.1 hypothetical protein [Pseudomonas alcaligenes]
MIPFHRLTARHNVTRIEPQQSTGGCIIDAQGREVPITEQMIQQACRELEKHNPPLRKRA